MKSKKILILFVLFCAVGCTTLELAKTVAVSVYKFSSKNNYAGHYKVGKPYRVNGKWYYPEVDTDYNKVGIASWYGDYFDAKLTANGEMFDKNSISAAHKTLPLPSMVRVTNLSNKKSILVRVNDRGPYVGDRIIDLSEAAAKKLGLYKKGTGKVRVEFDNAATNKMFADSSHAHFKRPESHKASGKSSIASWFGYGKKNMAKNKTSINNSRNRLFVQSGAYSNKATARQVANELKAFSNVVIQHVNVRNKNIFRVRMGPFFDERAADGAIIKAASLGYNDAIIIGN